MTHTKTGAPEKGGYDLKTIWIWGVMLVLFIVQLLVYTWCRVQCVQMGYIISKQGDRHQQLQVVRNSLKIELASLKSPERISKIARQQLGLSLPTSQQIRHIAAYETR